MKQLLLDINADVPQSFDTFVIGKHAEVVDLMRSFAQRRPGPFGERAVYLWGESGAGKSHLLRSLGNLQTTLFIDPSSSVIEIDYSPKISLYLIDDVQYMNDEQQVAIFNLYNQAKENNAFFVATGSKPPAILEVRDDLRTRLGWGLIYEIHALTDQEKIAALNVTARARGITLPVDVVHYLMNHHQRDMPTLSNTVDTLINFSLEHKRPITLPLLRALLSDILQSNE